MKRVLTTILSTLCVLTAMAEQNAAYKAYIAKWMEEAISQQDQYGIPASITLAQGLLESAAGQSELATEANNHFGIKCTTDWIGETYAHDDETANECFRKYDDARESFRDHSLFLHRKRYESLFSYDLTDYASWAHGLRACGYATDPQYPAKLIRIIEEYDLSTRTMDTELVLQTDSPELNTAAVATAATAVTAATVATQIAETPSTTPTTETTPTTPTTPAKAVIVTTQQPIIIVGQDMEPPYVEPLTASEERKLFYYTHPKRRFNGVRYVVAQEGDTYANVAFRLNMKERTLRTYNDALNRELEIGDRIYLKKKKKQGVKEHALLWVHPGESLWLVSQREAVQLNSILKYNGFPKELRVFKTRQTIWIRKPQEEKK